MDVSLSRGVVYGMIAFTGAYLLESLWSKVQPDIAHYDSMRAMSGEPSFMHEQTDRAKGLVGWLLSEQFPVAGGMTRGALKSLREDIARYAKLESM